MTVLDYMRVKEHVFTSLFSSFVTWRAHGDIHRQMAYFFVFVTGSGNVDPDGAVAFDLIERTGFQLLLKVHGHPTVRPRAGRCEQRRQEGAQQPHGDRQAWSAVPALSASFVHTGPLF